MEKSKTPDIPADLTAEEIKPTMIEWFDDHFYKLEVTEHMAKKNPELKVGVDYFPSVTTKLGAISKPQLNRWRGDVGNREADLRLVDGQDKGSRIHHAWYNMNNKGIVLYNPPSRPQFSFQQIIEHEQTYGQLMSIINRQTEMHELFKLSLWLDEIKPEIKESERILFSLSNREAGTMDNLMYIKGGKYDVNGAKPIDIPSGYYVFDLKTGNYVDDDAEIQGSAYANFYEEMYPQHPKINGVIICHSNSTTRTGKIPGLSTTLKLREEMQVDYSDFRAIATVWNRKMSSKKPKVVEFPNILKRD